MGRTLSLKKRGAPLASTTERRACSRDPSQSSIEAEPKRELMRIHGVTFDALWAPDRAAAAV